MQLVRQVRRLQAFSRRAHLYQHTDMPDAVLRQHRREWMTISFAPGFRPSFHSWVNRNLMLSSWYDDALAPCWWIAELYEKFKVFVDTYLRAEAHKRKVKFQYKLDVDMLHFGGSIAHALLRKPQPPRPQCLEVTRTFHGTLLRGQGKAKPKLRVESHVHPNLGDSFRCSGDTVRLCPTQEPDVYTCHGLTKPTGSHVILQQEQLTVDPQEACDAFFQYWDQYWMRDDPTKDPNHEWSEFRDFLEVLPQTSNVTLGEPITHDEWIQALKKTKTGTARGVCGFSQPELACMHVDLKNRIIQFFASSEREGLPPWMMVAKTVLIPKKEGTCKISDMRPITIFALLLRTWERVLAKRLLRSWMPTLPASIVGGVPGRSCSQLTLTNAIRVEKSLTIQSDAGGFSLDIAKCFNAVGRWPAMKLLTRAGMSDSHACMWHLSLSNMSRVVCLLDSVSDEHVATTGLLEGCPLSVCAMIQIGHGWSCLLMAYGVDVSVFADAWSWFAISPEQHVLCMRATEAWLRSLKLHSDPAKCWTWGTSAKARKQWSMINEIVVGKPDAYAVVIAERNLGAFLHLSRTTQLGTQKQRIQDGINKLYRIGKLPLTVNQKAHLVQVNVWPTVFFGIEVLYVGLRHFSRLRSATAACLVTKNPGTNVMLALTCLSGKVMDPMIYVLFRTLSLWRRLFISSGCEGAMARHLLLSADDDPNRAFGPATALKCYLRQINWKIDQDRFIVDHMDRQVVLESISLQNLFARLRDSWSILLQKDVQTRSAYSDWPEIDIAATLRTALPEDSRHESVTCIARTLGYLFHEQCKHWDSGDFDEDANKFAKCPLCGADNTRVHHPFHCPAQTQLSLEHSDAVDHVKQHFPHACFLPVIYMHPRLRLLQYIHSQREQPDPFQLPDSIDLNECVPRFYTDGSCAFPTLPGGHLAGYSVVLDLLTDDNQRLQAARQYRMGDMADTFQIMQVALVTGTQTINRAEFTAVLQVVKSCPCAILYVDSQWTIDTFHAVVDMPYAAIHMRRQNFDLIIELIHLAASRNLHAYELRKIKSHLTDEEVTDDLALYNVLGNRRADETAKAAIQPHRSELNQAAWEVGKWYLEQTAYLKAYNTFLVDTDIKRLDAFERLQQTGDVTTFDLNAAIAWNPSGLRTLVDNEETPCKFLAGFLPGASFFLALRRWASMLQWPENDNHTGGISFYELACNFLGTTGLQFPRIAQKGQRYSPYVDPRFHDVATLLPQTVWDLCRLIEHAFRIAYKFLGLELFPASQMHRRRYLGFLGYHKRLSGLLNRPVLVSQELHVLAMQRYVHDGQLHMPDPFLETPVFEVERHSLDDTPHEARLKVFNQLQYLARGGPIAF
eukprot:Skav200599  [mRNA]  locus=scaffold1278:134083:138135:- [translate_table: standard]